MGPGGSTRYPARPSARGARGCLSPLVEKTGAPAPAYAARHAHTSRPWHAQPGTHAPPRPTLTSPTSTSGSGASDSRPYEFSTSASAQLPCRAGRGGQGGGGHSGQEGRRLGGRGHTNGGIFGAAYAQRDGMWPARARARAPARALTGRTRPSVSPAEPRPPWCRQTSSSSWVARGGRRGGRGRPKSDASRVQQALLPGAFFLPQPQPRHHSPVRPLTLHG